MDSEPAEAEDQSDVEDNMDESGEAEEQETNEDEEDYGDEEEDLDMYVHSNQTKAFVCARTNLFFISNMSALC